MLSVETIEHLQFDKMLENVNHGTQMAEFHDEPESWNVKFFVIAEDADEIGQILVLLGNLLQNVQFVVEVGGRLSRSHANDLRGDELVGLSALSAVDLPVGAFA